MLSFRIALRYLLALRKASTVQILSLLSFLGILLGSMAMIIVLSAFNGFENLLVSIFHHQDPDLKVEKKEGKFFELSPGMKQNLSRVPGVAGVFEVMKDKAALQYDEGQMVVEVVGTEPASARFSRLDSMVKQGKNTLMEGTEPRALISVGIRNALDVSLKNQFDYLKILYPKPKKILKPGLSRIFNTLAIMPSGIMYRDENQVIIPLESARELMDKPSAMSHLEVFVSKTEDLGNIQEKLQSLLGEDFVVKNEMEQHADLFRILKIEKLFVFMALGFIILISSFNLFVSCSMLVINKKQDFFILSSLGMMPSMLSRLVHWLGGLISGFGLILGLALGWLVCLAQLWFGFVPLGMQSTQIQAYPIDIKGLDFILTSLWVMVVSVFAFWVPSAKARKVTFKSQA